MAVQSGLRDLRCQEDAVERAWEIREVQLRGEYPNTAIAIHRYDHDGDSEAWRSYPIWGKTWERPDGGRQATERIAADILTWALGG
jgi:hypothetical protein